MCLPALLAVTLALGFRADALQFLDNGGGGDDFLGERVLIVDVRGPTRTTGDGVRVMGMLMDLLACGHHVEVLSDAANSTELKKSWPHDVGEKFFWSIHFWRAAEVAGSTDSGFDLSTFSHIIIGAKLDLLYTDGREGLAVPYILSALRNQSGFRDRVVAFWDDVPYERCHMKPEADEICPRVPAVVEAVANVAHKFYVLSVDDRYRMVTAMQAHGIPMYNLDVNIWPMRIANMQEVVPYKPFSPHSGTRDLVVMMGNLHAVNRFMVETLFSSGAVKKMCGEIAARKSIIKIAFMGGLAEVAEEQRRKQPLTSGCVWVRTGFVTDRELEQVIYPRTRAVLNPFFKDVNSGISVKNFESIMSGVPFLSSEFGMHGLSDEIQACTSFPMPSLPGDPLAFAQFFVDNVVGYDGYAKFASAFAVQAPKCIQGQLDKYPAKKQCT